MTQFRSIRTRRTLGRVVGSLVLGAVAAAMLLTPRTAHAGYTAAQVQDIIDDTLDDFATDHPGLESHAGISIVALHHAITANQPVIVNWGKTPTTTGLTNVTSSTLFQIGSITKTVTSTLFAKWRPGGDENDTLRDVYLAMGRTPPSTACNKDLTLMQLADFWSGLPHDDPAGVNSLNDLYLSVFNDLSVTPSVIRTSCPGGAGDDNFFSPGTHYQYSNYSFHILGNVAADVGFNKTWDNAVQSEVLGPLAMSTTGTYGQLVGAHPHTMFHGESCNLSGSTWTCPPGSEVLSDPQTDWDHPSGSLWTTPNDMARWIEYNIGTTANLATNYPRLATAVVYTSQPVTGADHGGHGQGMAWEFDGLGVNDSTGQEAINQHKEGDSGEINQPTTVCVDLASGDGVAVMANFETGADNRPSDALCKEILTELVIP